MATHVGRREGAQRGRMAIRQRALSFLQIATHGEKGVRRRMTIFTSGEGNAHTRGAWQYIHGWGRHAERHGCATD
eukprot:886951-Prorocentrum_lima.AAC.1